MARGSKRVLGIKVPKRHRKLVRNLAAVKNDPVMSDLLAAGLIALATAIWHAGVPTRRGRRSRR